MACGSERPGRTSMFRARIEKAAEIGCAGRMTGERSLFRLSPKSGGFEDGIEGVASSFTLRVRC